MGSSTSKHTTRLAHQAASQELGLGGVELLYVEDSWARNLRFINSDNGAMVAYVSWGDRPAP